MLGNQRMTRRSMIAGSAAAIGLSTMSSTGPSASADPRTVQTGRYRPTWESLRNHVPPSWFDDAKLGIFVHWGIFSVPAWAPRGEYAEWYPSRMRDPNSRTHAYHRETYGAGFAYRDFIPMFRAQRWDPQEWSDLFAASGARYVVPVGVHHDGFPLWGTRTTSWNSTTMGPRRDILRELGEAVRAERMHYAPSYHQLLNYYAPEFDGPHPDYLGEKYLAEWLRPQLRELVEDIGTEMLWLDGDWMGTEDTFGTRELVAWYYDRAAERGEQVLVNDRLGKVRGLRGDFHTQEYDSGQGPAHKWEHTRGCGLSFGYNRNEPAEDYLTLDELVTMFVDNVAHWGNLLLNVGPRADGTIDDLQADLLRGLGRWLEVNGDGIYGTRPWRVRRGRTAEGLETRYTTRNSGERVYAFLLGRPGRTVTLPAADLPPLARNATVRLLGRRRPLRWAGRGDTVVVDLPSQALPQQPVHGLEFG